MGLVPVRSRDDLGGEEGDPAGDEGGEARVFIIGDIDRFTVAGGDVARKACACDVEVA